MRPINPLAPARAARALPIVGSLLAGCLAGPQSALDPQGPAATRILEMHWIMTGAASLVVAVVTVLLWRVWRGPPRRLEESAALRRVLLGGAAIPAIVVTFLFVYAVVLLGRLVPERHPGGHRIEVIGKQWWWEVRYLPVGSGTPVISANEIHLPAGEPVEIRLESSDVIHSLWVPALQGKTDLIPGRTTRMWLQADRPGAYRAQCAEFCGLQHARMALWVIAHAPAEFAAWLAREGSPAQPDSGAGWQAFVRSGCPACHTIRGTEARGVLGPDLTHLGSRRSLAAGTLPNTPGHLGGWIGNPQGIKPGNLMPQTPLSPEALRALVEYLSSLR